MAKVSTCRNPASAEQHTLYPETIGTETARCATAGSTTEPAKNPTPASAASYPGSQAAVADTAIPREPTSTSKRRGTKREPQKRADGIGMSAVNRLEGPDHR